MAYSFQTFSVDQMLTSAAMSQVEVNIRDHIHGQNAVSNWHMMAVNDTGAADAYVVTLTPAPAAYTTGMLITFKALNANTGASTLNVNALGTKAIRKFGTTVLEADNILAGAYVTVIYDGTRFQVLSQLPGGITRSGLKTTTATLSGAGIGGVGLVLNAYPFFPSITTSTAAVGLLTHTVLGSADSPRFRIDSVQAYSVSYRYVEA